MFINKFYGSDEMLKEYINKVLLRKMRKRSMIFAIIAILLLIICIMEWAYMIAGVLACCAFMFVFLYVATPRIMIREIKKQDRVLHNGESFESIITFGDKIVIEEGDVTISTAYSQIIKLHKLDLSWVLMTDKDSGVMIEPNSFGDKSIEEFEVFICEKCPNMER